MPHHGLGIRTDAHRSGRMAQDSVKGSCGELIGILRVNAESCRNTLILMASFF